MLGFSTWKIKRDAMGIGRMCKRCRLDDSIFVGKSQEPVKVINRMIVLLKVRKEDLSMKGGLEELVKRLGLR